MVDEIDPWWGKLKEESEKLSFINVVGLAYRKSSLIVFNRKLVIRFGCVCLCVWGE